MNPTLYYDHQSGRLMLSILVQGAYSHFPHYETVDLTSHIEGCVRRVLAEHPTRPSEAIVPLQQEEARSILGRAGRVGT